MNCAAFFPDGHRVLTASGGIRIGDEPKADATQAEWTGTSAVTGGIIKEDVDRSMRIWDVDTGQMVRHFAGLTIIVNCMVLSPDGLRILVGGRNGDIYLWDTETGKIVRRFETSMRFVHCLANTLSFGTGPNRIPYVKRQQPSRQKLRVRRTP